MDPITLTPTMASMLTNVFNGQRPDHALRAEIPNRVQAMTQIMRSKLLFVRINGTLGLTELGSISLMNYLRDAR